MTARPTDADMLADAADLVAAVIRSRLADYQARYRSMVMEKLVARRDAYTHGGPEWNALNRLLLDLGAAPRDPAAAGPGSGRAAA